MYELPKVVAKGTFSFPKGRNDVPNGGTCLRSNTLIRALVLPVLMRVVTLNVLFVQSAR